MDYTPVLKHIAFILTEECNNKCVHCYNNYTTRKHGFMSREVFDKGIRLMKEAKVRNISISGGEALLHPDLFLFIEQIKAEGFHLRLYSNGQNISDRLCETLQGCDLSPIAITIYSTDPSVHDRITNHPGSFQKTLEGVKIMKKHGIPFQVSVPLMTENIADATKTIEFCAETLGAASVGPNPFISYTVNHLHSNEGIIPSEDDLRTFAKNYFFFSIEKGFNIVPHRTLDEDNHIYNGTELTIQPDGTVIAGTLLSDIVLGNVFDDTFSGIWENSPILRKWRTFTVDLFEECPSCPYLYCCNPNIGDNWVTNHDLTEKDMHWCRLNKAYYSTLFELRGDLPFFIEVTGCPGFVFFPDQKKTDSSGMVYAEAQFNEKLASLKYGMGPAEIEQEKKKRIIVKLNQEK